MSPNPILQRLAIPGVSALIAFLAYTPQLFLFPSAAMGPGPLSKNQKIVFNALVACLWVCFFRAWWTDPGRVPEGWVPPVKEEVAEGKEKVKGRWCRKCEGWKPARAHHCRVCKRYVLWMEMSLVFLGSALGKHWDIQRLFQYLFRE
jgi:palmitoyltransferase